MTFNDKRSACWQMLLSIALLLPITTGQTQSSQSKEQAPFLFFDHLEEDQGITGAVRRIRQDRRGYLWCVVQHKGLLRFDGVQSRLYANNPDDPNSLPDNSIEDVLIDHNGLIWLASQTGMVRFDPVSERFSNVGSHISQNFLCLFEDHNNRIWAGTASNGLTFFDPQLDSMVAWQPELIQNGHTGLRTTKNTITRISNIAERADGTLWLTVRDSEIEENGIAMIDPLRRVWVYFLTGNINKSTSTEQSPDPFLITLFLDERKKSAWIGGYGPGLLEFSMSTHLWKYYDLSPLTKQDPLHNIVYNIQPKNDSILWIATAGGLKLFSTTKHKWTGLPLPAKHIWEAQDVNYLHVFRDQAGITWFGTGKGLSRLDPFRQQFALDSPLSDDYKVEAITEYTPTQEQIFASWDEDGYFRVMARHTSTNTVRQNQERLMMLPHETPCVRQLFVAADGHIWVLLDRGIAWLDPVTLRLKFLNAPIQNCPGCRTIDLWPYQITADPEQNLWIATFGNGIIRYTPSTGKFWKLSKSPDLRGSFKDYYDFTPSIYCDTAGRIFFSVNGAGLQMWEPKQQKFTLFRIEGKNYRSLGGRFVRCMNRDQAGNLWIGTEGGLCRYLPDMVPDSAFERVKGLVDWVYRIVPDKQGRLWLTTGKGLVCYDPQRKTWKKFAEKEGMVLPISVHTPLFYGSDEQIWLGNTLHFKTANIILDPPAAVPVITGFRVYDQHKSLPAPIEQNGQQIYPEILLRPNQEVFTIEIGTLGFTIPEQTRLLYRLSEKDAWQEAGSQRSFTFDRLPGGSYHFELKAIGSNGVESGRSVLMPLRVILPFYKTRWFFLLCIITVGGGVYILFRYREIQRLRQEKLRLRIARDLHDEVGSTLSSISILSESALRGVQRDLDKARLDNIGDKARAALNSISDIVWSINPENDSMEKALARMSTYASEMLESLGTQLRFTVGDGVELLSLPMEKRKDFYLIFKEAIHNCAKYARAQQVEVSLSKEDNILIMRIKDDGAGFDTHDAGQVTRDMGGNGLRNMAIRAAAIGSDLKVKSSPGAGTEIQLSMPL